MLQVNLEAKNEVSKLLYNGFNHDLCSAVQSEQSDLRITKWAKMAKFLDGGLILAFSNNGTGF